MAGGKITILSNTAGNIEKRKNISGTITTGSGTIDHNRLTNRDAADQHPISSISDLEATLKAKLDSKTALPLIEDAVKNKAKGLYYDVNKELAKKAYWYLTSEIDPITKMGTKASIISGPYDLGQGGGGGGGGGGVTEIKLDIAIDPATGNPIWPYNISVGATCIVGVTWSSLRDGQPTGRGNLYCYVNEELVETRNAAQGTVTFDITEYILSGTNKVEIKVADAYSTTKNLIDTVNGVTLKLTSNFEDDVSYSGPISYTYTPIGNIKKTVYFWVDGVLIGTEVVSTTGEQWTYQIPEQSHGAHTLRVYFIAKIDGTDVYSNELNYDIICYKKGNTTPIIASAFNELEQEQYASFVVKYRVYTPGKNNSIVYLYKDGKAGSPLTVSQEYQNWEVRFDEIGNHILKIATGNVSKTFNIHVKESSIDVQPVTQALALALSSYGRSNTEPIEERVKWDYQPQTGDLIESTLTGFNWASNGWLLDNDGNTILRLSGDARVTINYEPFKDDFTATGKTFEFEIATSDVKNYETRIAECIDGADTITYSQGYAGEDTRQLKFIVDSVNNAVFIEKVKQEKGTYLFTYDGEYWDLDGTLVTHAQLLSEYGITVVEIGSSEEETSHYLPGDRITVYYTVSGRGFYITPQLAKLQSQQVSLSTQYKEDDKVRLSFVVEKRTEGTETFKTRLIYMYINGILSGVTKYPAGDSFQQNPVKLITLGSNDATLDIYNIRIYNNNLTRRQVVNNWIADTKDPVLKTKRYKRNDNYNDEGQITIEKIAALGDLPYMVLNGPTLPAYKKDRKYMYITYTNPSNDDRDFTAEDARVDVQGTSSQYYYKKNFKIKFEGGFEDKNGNWSEHYKMRGDDSKKEKTFTFKADVASSEGANNVELVRYFEDSKNWYSPAELEPDPDIPGSTDSKKRIRVGIDGFPIVMFHNDETKTYFYGKMNFNNDKGNDRTFGFKNGDECWEFINNTTPLVLFKNDNLSDLDDKGNPVWQNSFESRYPEEAGDDEHPYGTQPGELDKLQAVMTWIVSTYRRPEDSEEVKTQKLQKFRNEFTRYFDKNSTLFYYLYTELFLMVDSRAKNAMLAYLKSRQAGDGGNKWFWMPYDMDTALGINNEGLLVFNYDREDTDLQEGAYIYNGQDSVFWNNVRDAFGPDLKKMYAELRNGTSERIGWSFDNIEKYFEDHQAVWSENIFNEDAQVKYLEPYINNQDATYLGMAQGSKAEQRRWWMYNRFRYLDSKYLTGDANKNTIMLRAYQRSNFELRPYMNCYLTAVFDQAQEGLTVTKKAEKGITTEIVPPGGWDPQSTDSVVILYSADLIEDIGDISGFKAGYADFSSATKLKRIVVGSSDPTYRNEKFKALNVGANHLLTYLDARNCTSLGDNNSDKQGDPVTPTIDLRLCYGIEEAYFDNTQIKGCLFPVGGNLKKVHLPGTLNTLEIRNHPNLEEFVLAGTENLSRLWLEDIPSTVINSYNYVMAMPEGSKVRLIGINENFNSVDQIKAFYNKLDQMRGLDAKGDDTDRVQITGKISIGANSITYADYTALTARYPEVEIIPDYIRCLVTFYNDGEWYDAVWVVQGNRITKSILPPRKESSVSTDYTFTNWDVWNSSMIIETDLNVNAVYAESVRKYTIDFVKQYDQATIDEPQKIVEWNTLVTEPVLHWEDRTVELIGWFNDPLDGTKFNFDMPIAQDYTLYAHWQDSSIPTVSVEAKTFDTFTIHGHDNVGISAYQVVRSLGDIGEWIPVYPIVEDFILDYQIDDYGTYYIRVKDSNDNIQQTQIIAYRITTNIAPGVESYQLTEDGAEISNFVLAGRHFDISATYDSHYENQEIKVNDVFYTEGNIVVWEDKVVDILCTPKKYVVQFNVDIAGIRKGTKPEDQLVTYLTKIEDPGAQYYKGYIVEGWYLEDTFENEWNFDTDVIRAEHLDENETVQLYAKWVEYSMPTRLEIVVPEAWPKTEEELQDEFDRLDYYRDYTRYSDPDARIPDKKIFICFTVRPETGSSLTVNWGDGTPSETYGPENYNQHVWHQYESAGRYTVELQGQNAYTLGDGYNLQILNPCHSVKNVEFSWDIENLASYCLKSADISTLPITDYMHTLEIGMFVQCNRVREAIIPKNIINIKEQALSSCLSLETVVIPDKVTRLRGNALSNNPKLADVTLPKNLEYLDYSVFYEDTSLTEITLPNTLKAIQQYCFQGTSIRTIDIPASVETIGSDATTSYGLVFASCYQLEKVILRNPDLVPAQQLFSYCPKLLTAGPIGGDYNIEFAWTEKIPNYAFFATRGNNFLTEITLPRTIKEIGDWAFAYSRISNIDLMSLAGLEKIGSDAFTGSRLTSIAVPSTVNTIGDSFCRDCTGLNRIDLYCIRSLTYPLEPTRGWFIGVYKEASGADAKLHIRAELDTPEEVLEAFGAYLRRCEDGSLDQELACWADLYIY